ncbi:SdrD B-like domain-containing protein [Caldimonas sp. KR1-144]|uniref:SdrD B-like domain-containing protein n=1 Tax=Caldimonas sp. KR1-144 TaxID=3400911 RepID=UPI003C0B2748
MSIDCLLPNLARRAGTLFQRAIAPALLLAFAGAAHAQLVVTGIPDNPDPVPAGGTVTYTVGIGDALGVARSNVTLNFAIPAAGLYAGTGTLPGGVSCAGMSIGQAGPGTVTCTGINVPALDTVQVPLRVRTQAAGTITVTASLDGGASQSETTTVNTGADLQLAINAPASAAAGSTQSVVLTVANAGPNASPSSTLTYNVPPGFTLSGTPGGCSLAGNTLSCSLGAIANGGNASVTVTGVIGVGGSSTLTHSADVSGTGGVGDGDTSNNVANANTAVTAGSSLSVTKTKSVADPVQVGQNFNFLFTVRYSGDFPAGVQLQDNLPANFCAVAPATFTSGAWTCTASSTCPSTGATLSCTRSGSGSAGSNVSLGTITAPVQAVTSGAGIVNTATASATGVTPVNGSLNTTVIDPAADLRANKAKSWPQAAVPVNQAFNYTISTTNLGPSAIPSSGTITLTDTVPANLQINSITPPVGFSCSSSAGASFPQAGPLTITCTSSNVSLAVNATTSAVTLNAQATAAGGTLTNQVCVSSANAPADNVAANDCTGVGVNPQLNAAQADVSVLKRVIGAGDGSGNRQEAGSAIVWEIEVVNAGPQAATNVAVTDTFNNVFNANASQYSLSTVAGSATLGSCGLAPSGSAVSLNNCTITNLPVCTAGVDCPRYQVSVRHFGDGTSSDDQFTVTNTAFALGQNEADPNLTNNNANNNTPASAFYVARADVAVTKTDNPDPVSAGQLLTYTITASNPSATSASRAFNVSVNDTLPAGLVFLSATANGGGSCTTSPTAGSTTGPGNDTLVCGWASIARGSQQTVTVRMRATAALAAALGGSGSITNQVTVSTTTPEIAGGAANNSATQATTINAPTYDLIVNKTDDADPINVGDQVTYTVTVTNNGASTAENVVLTDTLPSAAGAPTFVQVVTPLPAGVSCDTSGVTVGAAGGSISCTIASLGGTGGGSTGEASSVQVRVRLLGADKGTFSNAASVRFANASMDAFDPQANNSTTEPTTFRFKADVQVVDKTAVVGGTTTPLATIAQGQGFDWLVNLRNNGPQAAETTSFADTLPAGFQLTGTPVFTVTSGSFTPAAPTCTGTAGGNSTSCAITSMPSGGTATVRIPVQLVSSPVNGTVLTNTATIVTTGSGDTNGGANPNAGNNFGSGSVTVQTSVLSGRVYEDLNGSGQPDAGEPGIAGVTLTLTGTDSLGNPVTRTTTSDASGNWSFNVPAGSYSVTETQPGAYQPGITRAGGVSGAGSTAGTVPTSGAGVTSGPNGSNANVIQNVVLGTGGSSTNNLFGEVRTGSIAGRVYRDADYNDAFTAGEPGIAGVTLQLSGTDMFGNAVNASTTSAADASYSFAGLLPGSYTVVEPTQPDGFADGSETAGSAGGSTAVNDRISGIALLSNATANGYDFGERLPRVTVRVFEDANNDGVPAAGDAGITGVTLRLTGTSSGGTPVDIVATPIAGQPGRYEFLNVPPSGVAGYTITETQPATYAPGKANPNGQPGSAQPSGNVIQGVVIAATGTPASLGDYLFGELTSSQIRGRSYYDRNGDGSQGALATEPGLAGVAIALTGTDDNGNAVSLTTTTDANGDYVFNNVAPGSYTVTETRPAGYLPGLTRAGTVTGAGSLPGIVPTSGSGVSAGPNGSDAPLVQNIRLGSPGSSSSNNNFASVRAASIAGHVYADTAPPNGQRDAGEAPMPGVTVTLSGTDFLGRTVSRTLTTAADGSYSASDLLPGSYQLDETQPAGAGDGPEHLGSVGGTPRGSANPGGVNDRFGAIALVSEEAGVDYDFGERGGQITGRVYVDSNGNGQRDAGELPIAGVTLTLTGTSAGGLPVNLTATTDADGLYLFDGVLPSNASGYTIAETQPVTYADGADSIGRLNGTPSGSPVANDRIGAIVYSGGGGDGYDFGERGATLAGSVFNDANGNGTRDGGDLPLAGVVITLTGTDAAGQPVSRTTTTARDGSYRFPDLPLDNGAGYTLVQSPVPDSTHAGESPGSLGGTVPAPRQLNVKLPTVAANGVAYDFFERSTAPAAVSGRVWRDTDHDRQADADEPPVAGWTVELVACIDGGSACANTGMVVLDTRTTASDGSYRFDSVVPGAYQVRFRDPQGRLVGGVWPTDPVLNAPNGSFPTVPGMAPRGWIPLSASTGVTVINQDLPLDPGGVVFDSLSAEPVAGAVVTLNGPSGFDAAAHLLGGSASLTTGPGGEYQFFLLPGAPAGDYTVTVTPPAGYVNSLTYPPATGPLDALACAAPGTSGPVRGSEACIVSAAARPVAGAAAPYFLAWQMGAAGARPVVNNHIPLDREGAGTAIELRKTTSKLTVKKGEPVPYVITARNASGGAIGNVALVDTLPPGFKYLDGSLTVQTLPDGPVVAVKPSVVGRQLTLADQNFVLGETKRLSMVLAVGVGVGEGQYVNSVLATQGAGGRVLSNTATAAVRVVPDALFDCTDVIGKVYDDKNANGWQDDGEPGIPNVRIATVNGLLVNTDADGRYHIACAAVPKEGTGSNLVLKLDERTLPSGYRVTTENPAAERATRGKAIKLNFGATVHRVVRLDLKAAAFVAGEPALQPAHQARLDEAVAALAERPSILRLAYQPAAGEPVELGERRLAALKAALLERWTAYGRAQRKTLFNLDIEVERVPSSLNR